MDIMAFMFGQLPEAIYFALFMIFVKDLKERRILFITLTIIEYLLFLNVFKYNVYGHIGFFICTYCILKILYKERAQIIDVFSLCIASIILIGISAMSYGIGFICGRNFTLALVLNRITMFLFILVFNTRLHSIQLMYKKHWNRHDERKSKIKSTTFRAINACVFNVMFYGINLGLIFILLQNRR